MIQNKDISFRGEDILREGERLDDLQRDGLMLIQNGSVLAWMPCFLQDLPRSGRDVVP